MAALQQLNGLNSGKKFQISETKLLVGRSDECGIVLSYPSVSRKHCEIWADSTGFYVRDLGSRNQTCLNDRKIFSDELLVDGDEIQVSSIRFRFLGEDSLSEKGRRWPHPEEPRPRDGRELYGRRPGRRWRRYRPAA